MISSRNGREVVARFDKIDILRGLSILAVVLAHIALRMRFAGHSLESTLPPWLFHLLFWNGNTGVTVFFAISGFLITITSIRRFGGLDRFRIGQFYRIRFARIAPLLLLLLGMLSVLHLAGAEGFVISPQKASLPRALLSALTFHLNWLEAERGYLPASWDVLWSLSVEEMFYLMFPVACLLVLRARSGGLLFAGLLFSFVAMGPLARTVWSTNELWREKSYLSGMDAIAMGCLSALLTDWLLRKGGGSLYRALRWRGVEGAGFGLILLVAVWPRWDVMRYLGRTGLDGTLLAFGTCLVMIGSVLRGSVPGRWTAPVRWFGRLSYEVYLTHEFVVIWGTAAYVGWQRVPLALWFVLLLVVSALLGAVVARWFSEPLNRRLRKGGRRKPGAEAMGECTRVEASAASD
ncbi:MAG: acyltransferase [Acidobacteriota bacterium]